MEINQVVFTTFDRRIRNMVTAICTRIYTIYKKDLKEDIEN